LRNTGRASVLTGRAYGRALTTPSLSVLFAEAFAREVEERRLFLWLPIVAIAGVALYFEADREPSRWLSAVIFFGVSILAYVARNRRLAFGLLLGFAALSGGFLSAGLRCDRVAAPMLDHVRIVKLKGTIEALDLRQTGARMILKVDDPGDMPASIAPRRVRVTMRQTPEVTAGDEVTLTARLLPPTAAVLPGGYDFARDAFFSGVGAVGSTFGTLVKAPAPTDLPLSARLGAVIDHLRNALAIRVDTIIGGDEGAIAAAMVTGKRDFLSNDAKDLIREAGIFHIITISGVQMTLVAGIFFWTTRRLLVLSPTLALRYPVKKWAAGVAMLGAFAYDMATGARVGAERALVMTLIVLGAVIVDRRALTMRNLALAIFVVVAMQPEAVLGVSFQLSFAAVGALVSVFESRLDRREGEGDPASSFGAAPTLLVSGDLLRHLLEKPVSLIVATLFATAATASFMAYHFHDLSPYVLIGNPLTLTVIEFFAVPGALVGTALYPLGLDAQIWLYVGAGIRFILWVARHIAAAPGATLHLRAFAPYALAFLSLAVVSALIWRSWLLRASAIPLAVVGLLGATHGSRYDVIVAPDGGQAAIRDADDLLTVVGKRFNAYAAEQWLAADGDGREAEAARPPDPSCDRLGCTGALPRGLSLSVVEDRSAFDEDCGRAAVIVTRLTAPAECAASFIFDEKRLAETGAVGIIFREDGTAFIETARSTTQDRPWSPAPKRLRVDRPMRPGDEKKPTHADPADPVGDPETPQ
jgi:competence protein ComEC